MAKLYPHKQTVIIFLVCFIFVSAMVRYSRGPNTSNTQYGQGNVAVAPASIDGIATTTTPSDWQKQFFGTATTSIKLSAKNNTPIAKIPLTITNEVGRNVFTQYANLKQSGLIKDSAMVNSAMSGVITQAFSDSDKARTYLMSDIIVIQDNSVAKLREYGNSIGKLFQSYAPTQDDAALALAGMQGKDPAYKEKIGANITRYNAILTNLLKIPTPASISKYHLQFVNDASNMIFIASSFQVSESDPLRAINGLKMYSTQFPLILKNIAYIKNAIASAGISYNEGEGGDFFKITKI